MRDVEEIQKRIKDLELYLHELRVNSLYNTESIKGEIGALKWVLQI